LRKQKTKQKNMTSWEIICEKLEKDETSPLIRALKLLVGDAKDLALISMEEIEEIANQGLLNETTKPLLYDYLNSWQVIFYRIALSDDAMKTCIKEFRVPSDVLSMCEWMKEVELENFSTITHRALLSRLDNLLNPGKWQMLNTVQDSKDDEARNEAKQLFSTITFPDDKDCCISSDIVVDDKHENNTSGYIPFCQLLSLASETVKVIDSSIGTIENLDKDINILHGFNHLQLVDLCENRLDQSQWVNITSILSFFLKNQGGLLIHDNPFSGFRLIEETRHDFG